ncbi:hypothetical protein ABIB35_001322 [Arthrobacter sp. UYP6]
MSSLPASPNPQKPRVPLLRLSQKVRGTFRSRIRTASTPGAIFGAPPPAKPSAPIPAAPDAAAQRTPAADPPAGTAPAAAPPAGTALPAAPTSAPKPPLPARIPYNEWKGPRPRAVRLGFTLIMLAGLISFAGGVAASRRPITELPPSAVQLGQLGVNVKEYAATVQAATLGAAVVVLGVYVLFAFMIREGRNWARIGGSVLAAAALAITVQGGSEPQALAVLVASGGLALLYRQDCARYFRPRRSQYLGMG